MLPGEFLFLVGTIAQRQTHNTHFVDFVPVYTETAYVHTAAMSEYMPAVVEALLPITHKNVWAIIATLLRAPGKSGAPQATTQRVLDDHDSDSEKHELADKERKLRVLPRRALYKPCPAVALIIAHSEPQPLREAPIHDSADGDELARPIRNIKAAQLQGIAEQNEGMTINVLARTNHELGLVVATDEIAYVVDAYLDMQATDAGIARNQTDAELMMFAQVNSKH
ncbi:phosphoribosylformylglycinamidine synthase [Coemansia sp. RSA 2610]|nr:phosphoribosylformylglycinamidine synthase [Coemansia sp. RSA 2610]